MKNICFIPVRAGSERVKDKHTIRIGDKTILEITIEQALKSGLFSEVHFSSNDEKMIETAEKAGIKTFKRRSDLADSKTGVISVIQDHINNLGLSPDDSLCLFQATNILRTREDILNGYKTFEDNGRKRPVMSVGEHAYPVELTFKIEDGYLAPKLQKEGIVSSRKQDYEPSYFWNDAFIFDSIANWSLPDRKLFTSGMIPYIMPAERSIGIDYPFQVLITKALYREV